MSAMRLDPNLVAAAKAALDGQTKEGFVPMAELGKTAQGMPGAMPPGGGAMPPGGGAMPPGAPPMDPAMMGGAPPGAPPMDPMGGGMPPPPPPPAPPPPAPPGGGGGGQPIMVTLEDLMMLFQQVAQQSGGGGGEGVNETGNPPETTSAQLGERLDGIETKLGELGDILTQLLGGPPPAGPGVGAPPGAEAVPPDLAAAMMGGPAGGPPPAELGSPIPEQAAAGVPPMPPPPGMPVSAGQGEGIQKPATLAALAAKMTSR